MPRPERHPYMPYSTAGNRFGRMLDYLGISGAPILAETSAIDRSLASERGSRIRPTEALTYRAYQIALPASRQLDMAGALHEVEDRVVR